MLALALLGCPQPVDTAEPAVLRWDASLSIDADFVVPAGTTLQVAPGVTVTFAPEAGLIVEGELVARGTEAAPIVFTGEGWGGIRFAPEAVGARFEGVDVYAEGSIVEHAVVERAARGMHVRGASPYLYAVTFRDNELAPTVDTVGGAGLLVSDGSTSRVRACRFEGNVAKTFAFGGGLYVDRADPIVQDSVFVDNVATYGAGLSTDRMAAPVVGSRFEGNDSASEGGGASLVSTVSALLANTFVDNHAKKDGAGLHVCVTCDPHAAPYLFDNTVTGNLSDNTDPDEGAAGVGAAYLGAMRDNAVHGNLRAGQPSDFGWFHPLADGWADWVANPAIPENWWGTADPAALEAAVWDGHDDPAHGVVALQPVRQGPPGDALPRVIVATRRQHYTDPDVVPVFLTVYNPGPERAVALVLTRDGAPFGGAIGYPGAVAGGEGFSLVMPENSVWFGTLDESPWDGATPGEVTWEARLLDEGGEVLGVPVVARYLLGEP